MLNSERLCRVCLAEGARHIFSSLVINDESCTVASINNIREKLQYVTLLQVDEHDGLPFWICELCIIQLNLAYRFKRLAAETDNKLRQHRTNAGTTDAGSAITYDVPAESTESTDNNVTMSLVKSEPSEASTGTENANLYNRALSVTLPENSPNLSGTVTPGIVCVHKDVVDPAKDEEYLNTIFKEKVIAIPWKAITPPMASSETDQSKSTTDGTNKPTKSSKKRKRSENRPHDSTTQKKTHKSRDNKKEKEQVPKPASEPVAEMSTIPARPAASSAKANSEMGRKKRIVKMYQMLRIDMMDDRLPYNLRQPNPLSADQSTSAKLPLKRRNSICISSIDWPLVP